MQHDGLWEVTHKFPMGNCGEETASKHGITREEQDAHAIESYKRAAKAWQDGQFEKEIAPVVFKDKKVCMCVGASPPIRHSARPAALSIHLPSPVFISD